MKILAIASGGGHWEQLMLLRPAFDQATVKYVTTLSGLPSRAGIVDYALIHECNRNNLGKLAINCWKLSWIIFRFRPNVVISTGALPGLIAIILAKVIFRKRTIWIDSVANAKELSLSGKSARHFSNLWVTQWEEVAASTGASYLGRVI